MFRKRRLWALIAILSAIGLAVVVRRAIALTEAAQSGLDAGFVHYRLLTAIPMLRSGGATSRGIANG
jgi:hypothetical protein